MAGLAEGEELLYDLGLNEISEVNRLLVDGDYAYWYQRTDAVNRAPKDGSGPIEVFGRWENTLSGSRIASDENYIYWLDDTCLRRKPKAGGNTESAELVGDYHGGDFVLTDDAIFVASFGCPTLARIDKQTFTSTSFGDPLDIRVIASGHTELIAIDSTLYCANDKRLVRIGRTDGKKTLVSDATTAFAGLASIGPSLYLIDFTGLGNRLYRLDDDRLTTLLDPAWGVPPPLVADTVKHELFWIGGTPALLFRFATDTGALSSFGEPRGTGRGLALDENYVYFGDYRWVNSTTPAQSGPTGSLRRIRRPE